VEGSLIHLVFGHDSVVREYPPGEGPAKGLRGVIDQADTPAVLWLDDPRCREPDLAGNKCATLAQLCGLGYDVPEGFCLTTAALQAGADFYGRPVRDALSRLPSPWVARSSATAEDSPAHAFPGLFGTYLGLADTGSLFAAIERIAAGPEDETIGLYAERVGVDPEAIRMAVLVQGLVPAKAAGVAFSRDPVSAEQHVVIEANHGLGETVVDGSVKPDRFTVGTDGEVVARALGCKRTKAVLGEGGVGMSRVETTDLERSSPALDDDEIAAVAALTRRLEADLGHLVDVEWAFADSRLLLLQARPLSGDEPTP
jgi:phosphoenolpyruvate synthase/pyruvate phosphate dikinase